MTDATVRELERRWRETGAVQDEARFLLETVRAGELTRARLALAACVGHPAAKLAVDDRDERPRTFRRLSKVLADRRTVEALDAAVLIATIIEAHGSDERTKRAATAAALATRGLMRAEAAARDGAALGTCSAWWDVCGLDVVPDEPLVAKDVVRLAVVAAERFVALEALREAFVSRALETC
jgi:hypothetical protein